MKETVLMVLAYMWGYVVGSGLLDLGIGWLLK